MRKTFLTCTPNPRGTMKYYLWNNETAMCVSVSLNHYGAKSFTKIGICDIGLGIDTERRVGKNVCKKTARLPKTRFQQHPPHFHCTLLQIPPGHIPTIVAFDREALLLRFYCWILRKLNPVRHM